MGQIKEELEIYLTRFEAKGNKKYSYITLFQESSGYEKNFFRKGNPAIKTNEAEIKRYLAEFFKIYGDIFNGNMAEDVSEIQDRILPECYKNKSGDDNVFKSKHDQAIITLCLSRDGENMEVVGGMILKYNPAHENAWNSTLSHCILTCLFFREDHRERGLGTYFIKEILPIITYHQIWVGEKHVQPSYVFFESNNPIYANRNEAAINARVEKETDMLDPGLDGEIKEQAIVEVRKKAVEELNEELKTRGKLEFFQSVGAKWLDICYVQPKLSEDKARAYNLLFLILPEVSTGLENPFIIDKKDVLVFLMNFYQNLEKESFKFETPSNEIKRSGLFESLKSILKVDVDLYRSCLSIEIADAIDDFEHNLIYDKVVKLRALQRELEGQLDFIADLASARTSREVEAISCVLSPIFSEGLKKGQLFKEKCEELIAVILEKNKEYDSDFLMNLLTVIVEKYNKLTLDLGNSNSYSPSLKPENGQLVVPKIKGMLRSLKEIDSDLKNILDSDEDGVLTANDTFYLKEVPKFQAPQLQFDKSSVAFNIALNSYVDSKYFTIDKLYPKITRYNFLRDDETIERKLDNVNLLHLYSSNDRITTFQQLDCPIFKSYENDLLAFNYYEDKTRTKNKFLTSFTIDVTFPYKIEYLSEGRKEVLFLDVGSDENAKRVDETEQKFYTYKKRLQGFLNVKYFKDDVAKELAVEYERVKQEGKLHPSKRDQDIVADYEVAKAKSLVWSVVFTNSRDGRYKRVPLSEYEIIILAKQFSGKQERSYVDLKFDNIQVKSKKHEQLVKEIFDIIDAKIKREVNVLYDVHSGVIQTDTLNARIFSSKTGSFVQIFEPKHKPKGDVAEVAKLAREQSPLMELLTTKQRIGSLLEEYLKDNVDNVELLNRLYPETNGVEEEPISYHEIYRNARDFHYDDAFTGFEDRYKQNRFLKYFCNALCGISLGIFDFQRMGYEEVTDTLLPLKESSTDNAMIIMKRASIFSCCHENSVFESSIDTIGMSPYLIIPNAVLVYNRLLADHYQEFQQKLMQLTADDLTTDEYLALRDEAGRDLNLKSKDLYQILLRLRRRTESYLDNVYIPNIFNYPTEKEIYVEGSSDRGINELHSKISLNKREMDERIKEVVEQRNTIYEKLVAIFLGLLSFGGFYDFMHQSDLITSISFLSYCILNSSISVGDTVFLIVTVVYAVYFGRKLYKTLPSYVVVDWQKLIERVSAKFRRAVKVILIGIPKS